jgi:hypothetical protein
MPSQYQALNDASRLAHADLTGKYLALPPGGLRKFPNGYWHRWENVEDHCRKLASAHGGVLPGPGDFQEAGLGGLYATLPRWGGIEVVRERLGLAGKRCASCREILDKEAFRLRRKDGHAFRSNTCRDCEQRATAEYRNTWPGRAAELTRRARDRAKPKQIEFDLDKAWVLRRLEQAGFCCEVTGLPLDASVGETGVGFANRTGASLDRIDSTRGYTKDNVRVAATRMNVALGDLTDEMFEPFAIGFLQRRGFSVTRDV